MGGKKKLSLKQIERIQAKKDEKIIAQGKIEQVTTNKKECYCRLILGSKLKDYMILSGN